MAHGVGGEFVGRQTELAALRDALAGASAGRGRLALLVGEPGIGKTRLAEELAMHARDAGAEVIWGRAWEGDGAPSLWPWVQVLRSWIGAREPGPLRAEVGSAGGMIAHVVPELVERLPEVVAAPLPEGESGRFRLLDGIATALRRAARTRPLVLVLDDLHWADEASLALLQLLARDVATTPMLLVGTFRDTDVDRDDARARILGRLAREGTASVLQGFRADDVRALVAHTAGVTPSSSLVGAVLERTDGNPLFVGEIVRLLIADGALEAANPQASWARRIPAGVQETIRRRVDRLPAACAAVLRRAAVLGREFEPRVLDRMRAGAHEPPALDVIDAAVNARLVVPAGAASPGRHRFAHDLVREALYADLSTAERIGLHRAAGDALEAVHAADLSPHLAALAHHFVAGAADGDAERALAYAEAAARRALQLRAYEDAARLYELALGALGHAAVAEPSVRRTELELARADACSMASDDARTRDAYAAIAEAADRLGLAEPLARAALGAGGRGDMAGAPDPRLIALLERALVALGPADSTLRSRVLSRLSGALTLIPDTRARRRALSDDAIAIAERTGDADALAFALVARHLALYGPGHLEDRLAVSARLLELVERAGSRESLAMGLQWRAMALLEAGDVQAADRIMQRYAALADELRQPAYQVHMAEWRAMRALLDGRFGDAEPLIAEALAVGAHGDPMNTQMRWVSQMAVLRREQGRLEEMSAAIFGIVEAMPSMPAFRAGAAMVAVETGRMDEARVHFDVLAADDFAGFPRDAAWAGGVAQLAGVCAALADVPRAAVLYELVRLDAGRNLVIGFANACEGSADHYLGMLATVLERYEQATSHFEAALAMNARMGARPALAHTQREYAAMLAKRGGQEDAARAMQLLAAATATYDELGMTRLAERCRRASATSVVAASAAVDGDANVFARQGDFWTVGYGGTVVRLKDGKGLHYIAELLRRPGARTHVLDLAMAVEGSPAVPGRAGSGRRLAADDGLAVRRPGDIADGTDARARREYRRRAGELQQELEEAERNNDMGRMARLRAELELIGSELGSAYGIGRARRANDVVEKARKAVTNRIRAAVERLNADHAALGRHLSGSLRLGTWCSYEPDPTVPWRLG